MKFEQLSENIRGQVDGIQSCMVEFKCPTLLQLKASETWEQLMDDAMSPEQTEDLTTRQQAFEQMFLARFEYTTGQMLK